jgi:hypothetical protein
MKVTFKKKRGKQSGRYLIRCDCGYLNCPPCGERIEIHVPDDINDEGDDYFEIQGVIDHKANWIKLFKEIGLLENDNT